MIYSNKLMKHKVRVQIAVIPLKRNINSINLKNLKNQHKEKAPQD